MSSPIFGFTFTQQDNEIRPVVESDMSVIGLIGTAPAADAETFPVDTPVLISSSDATKLAALGATGTLADAVKGINDQVGYMGVSAKIVVVRVTEGADAAATIAAIVGDEATMTGVHAFKLAPSDIGVIPRILIAPGYTHQITAPATSNPVVEELAVVAEPLLAHAIVEGPGTTETAITDWRESINSKRVIPVDLWVYVLEGTSTVTRPGVSRVAGLAVAVDYEHRGRPMHSWANRPIRGIVGLVRNPAFSLTDGATEGQRLLAANVGIAVRGELGVESAIASSGYVFVGTDNAGTDDVWRFYNQTRGRDFIHLGLMRAIRSFLGPNNIEGHVIQAVLNTADAWLNLLKADVDIIDFRIGFEKDVNTPENIRLGRFRFFFKAEEPSVLRRVDIDSLRYREALDALVEDILTSAAGTVAA